MKRFLSSMFAACLLITAPAAAQGQIEGRYQQIFSTIDNLSVDFTQTTYKKLRNKTVTRSGQAFFSKPGMFRWNFGNDKLGVEEYYFNGERLTHYREREKLVNHYNTNASFARELQEVVNLVLDPKELFNRYTVKDSKSEGGRTSVILVPKQKDGTDIESIHVKVSDAQKYVEDVQIYYLDGNNTQFSFRNPKKAKNEASLFIFSRKGNFTVRHHG